MLEVSLEKVRKFILEKQGVITKNPPKSVLDVARRIHNIQIDTISVVARSHDLTIFNRFEDYKEKKVWDYLKQKKLFEYYSRALCLIPIEDFPFYHWKMLNYKNNKKTPRWEKWLEKNQKIVEYVYNTIKKEGAMSSKDFETKDKKKSSGWGNWKTEKSALEYLFYCGELLISHRERFQKYYNLSERVLPNNISNEPMEMDEIPDYLVKTIFSALGIGNSIELRNYIPNSATRILWNNNNKRMVEFLDEQVKEGILEKVRITSLNNDYYVLESEVDKLQSNNFLETDSTKFLNPFDNIIHNRRTLKKYWNFDFKLEAYVPQSQRVYGYYVLPILDEINFIGRLEPKVYRKNRLLEIKSLYFEDSFTVSDEFFERFKTGLEKFARFHDCEEIIIGENIPNKYNIRIKDLFNQ